MATNNGSGAFSLPQIIALFATNSFLFGNLNADGDRLTITNKYSEGFALSFSLFWAKAGTHVYDLVHVVDGQAQVLGTLSLGQAGNWTRRVVEQVVSGAGSDKFPNATFTIGSGSVTVSDPTVKLSQTVEQLEQQLEIAKAAAKAAGA